MKSIIPFIYKIFGKYFLFALFTFSLIITSGNVWAQKSYKIVSPDGKLQVTVNIEDSITYSLSHESTRVLSASPISMTLESGEILGKSPKVVKAKQSNENRTLPSPFYKKSHLTEKYNELVLTFRGNYGLIFRAYNNGLAYRFTINRKGALIITKEEFTLNFPKDYKAFAAYPAPDGSFESQMYNSFEGPYVHEPISELNTKKLIYLPVLIELDEGKKLCITEADLYGYPGAWFNGNGTKSLKVVHAQYPKKKEPRNSSYFVLEREKFIAKTTGTRVFPWRLLIVSENDSDLIGCDMVYSVAEPCRIPDPSWIKPGKVVWDWWHGTTLTGVDFRSGMNTGTFKYYVDFAAKNGIEYVLVDAGWAIDRDNILAGVRQGMDIAELVKYGLSKNVGILLWMSYRAFHHDMENVSRHFSNLGVKGFKIDFQDRDDQQIADYIYNAAEICAKHKLLIDFHGIHKPTGLQRTWPNVINYEGVMGLEWVKFGNLQTLDMVTNDVTIPFIRMVAGPFDYTPGAMLNASKQNFRVVNSEPMSQGTRCRQLAAYIVFDAPLAMISDRPSNYEKEKECLNFLAKIPTVWEETIPLTNKVSEYVSVARKKGDEWYIGGMTNWDERELTIDLSFLDKGNYKLELFTDGANANRIASDYKKRVINIPMNRKLTINMAQGGGFAARIFLAAGEQDKNQDFFYGINVHPQYGAGPYRSSNLEKWMHLAANLGVTIIRANHSSGGGWTATDDFLTLCDAYGIDVMLHLENSRNPESMRAVAERYKGRIKYYGISNEQETSCLKTGVRRNNEYGNPIEDFDPEKLDNRANEMKSNIAAIKEAYPEAIVTYSIISGYDVFAKAMKDRGVEIDVICANMYFNDDSDATIARINNSITKLVQATGVPAIFAEFNVGYSVREVVSADAATATMYPKYFDAFRNNPDLLGVIVYELLDEANYTNKEAHFGLVKTNNIFEIGEYKVSYNAYKDYIRGKGAPEIPMKKMSR